MIKKLATVFSESYPIILIYAVIISLYVVAFLFFSTPLRRMNYDTFTQIGLIKTWLPQYANSQLYPGLFQLDLRTRFYYLFWTFIHARTDISYEILLLVNGVINITVFFFGFLYFVKGYELKNKVVVLILVLVFFALGPLWALNDPGYTIFSIADLMIGAFYPQILGIGLMFFTLGIARQYFSQKKLINGQILAIFVLFLATFVLHLFTGMVLILLLGLMSLSQIIVYKKITRKVVVLGFTIAFGLLFSLFVPGYSWLPYVLRNTANLQSSEIGQGIGDPKYYSFQVRASIIGITILGLPLILDKSRNLFLRIWILVFAVISISFLFPFKFPYFWRFTNIMKIPLAMIFAQELVTGALKYKKIIITLLIVFSFTTSFSYFFQNVTTFDDTTQIAFTKEIKDSVILADDIESNYIEGETSNSTITVPSGHITSPDILKINLKRQAYLKPIYEGNLPRLKDAIQKYGINYIILNKFSDQYNYKYIGSILPYQLTYENDKYVVYKVESH